MAVWCGAIANLCDQGWRAVHALLERHQPQHQAPGSTSSMTTRDNPCTTHNNCAGALCSWTRRLMAFMPRRISEPRGPLDVIVDVIMSLVVARGASAGTLAALPKVVCTPATSTCGDRCAICLGDVEAGDVIKHLRCNHSFHDTCIDAWLTKRAICPICKSDVY